MLQSGRETWSQEVQRTLKRKPLDITTHVATDEKRAGGSKEDVETEDFRHYNPCCKADEKRELKRGGVKKGRWNESMGKTDSQGEDITTHVAKATSWQQGEIYERQNNANCWVKQTRKYSRWRICVAGCSIDLFAIYLAIYLRFFWAAIFLRFICFKSLSVSVYRNFGILVFAT